MFLKPECNVFANITYGNNPIKANISKSSRTIHIKRPYKPNNNTPLSSLQHSMLLLFENSFPSRNINVKNYKKKYYQLMTSKCGELMFGMISKIDQDMKMKKKEQNKPMFHTKIKEFKLSKSYSTVVNSLKINSNNISINKTRINKQPIKLIFQYNELNLKDRLLNIVQKAKETNDNSIHLEKEISQRFRNKHLNQRNCQTNNTNSTNENDNIEGKSYMFRSQKMLPVIKNNSLLVDKYQRLPKKKYNRLYTIYTKNKQLNISK